MAKTVLVTGGTIRLGRVVSDFLSVSGWRVLRSSSRPGAGADLVADLSRPDAARRLFDDACELAHRGGGRLDAIVNNAAVYAGADEAKTMSIGFFAPSQLVELFGKRCATKGVSGSVVNILDAAVLDGGSLSGNVFAPYVKAKRALMRHTADSAERFAAGGLRVNAVAPGPVLAPVDVHEKAGRTPLGRPTPCAVAEAVAFLLEARFTTGCTIPVSGAFCGK